MDEYIKLEALIEWLKRIPLIDLSDGRGLCRAIMEDDFKKAIKKIPKGIIADVTTVRHGRWIDKPTGRYGQWQAWCSVCDEKCGCGGTIESQHKMFCPNCCEKMDLKEDHT